MLCISAVFLKCYYYGNKFIFNISYQDGSGSLYREWAYLRFWEGSVVRLEPVKKHEIVVYNRSSSGLWRICLTEFDMIMICFWWVFGTLVNCIILAVSSFFPASARSDTSDFLFKDGKTGYTIVASPNASATERTAALELQDYLKQISSADFKVSSRPGRQNVYIGYDEGFSVYDGLSRYADDSEGFTIRKIGRSLVIYGGRERGTMYGVFRFLQECFDVQWYTPIVTKVPQMRRFELSDIYISEEPKLRYRYTDSYHAQDSHWYAHNMMNVPCRINGEKYSIVPVYWGIHTFAHLLPSQKYFKDHPEYFSYRYFRRVEDGQLCLSNPDVLSIVTKEILSVIERNPNYLIYDVSQNDNNDYCTCSKCAALEREYGGHSGLMLWFVNQVAREVKKTHPDKFIGTFAYLYTRQAPTKIKPDDNVVIRLCDIECCFAHPLSSECNNRNASYMQDISDWSKLTNNIFIWDYIVNYRNYLAPFPNIQVLGPNLRTFADHNAVGVFEEANPAGPGSPFEALTCWLLGQLMWNPYQDEDKLISKFINDYYGEAAKDIMDYYNLCVSLVDGDKHMKCFNRVGRSPFTDQFVEDAYPILNRALAHAENDEIVERVRKVMLQPLALDCERHPRAFYKKGRWPEYKSLLLKYNPAVSIRVRAQEYIEAYEKKYVE